MHSHSLDRWTHDHVFLGEQRSHNERRVWVVVGLTVIMMVMEIAGGSAFGSLALIADGWHMSTHAVALTIAGLAYAYARRHAHDSRFAFGTGKLGDLASFASALILAMVALLIAYDSVMRLFNPVDIAYPEAIAIAILGLAVNLLSAWLLGGDHHHHDHYHHDHDDHHHDHDHSGEHAAHAHHHAEHGEHSLHRDHNLQAAYVHVLADAATSVLAIGGLLLAWRFGWNFADPMVGFIGAAVILIWAYGLIRDAGGVLLDMTPNPGVAAEMRQRLEKDGDKVADLHLWRVGVGHLAAVITVVSDDPRAPDDYKARLKGVSGLSHVSVEVQRCTAH